MSASIPASVTYMAEWAEDRPPHPAVCKSDRELERFFVSAAEAMSVRKVVERSTWESQWYTCQPTESHQRLIEMARQVSRLALGCGTYVITVPRSVATILNQRMVLEVKEPIEASVAAA
jgi:hypothetical protein